MSLTSTEPKILIAEAEAQLSERFAAVDDVAMLNQKKVLSAFREHRLTEEFFVERTGYGLSDPGRAAIDAIFASVFGTESAAVRMQLVSGTHAIASALFGVLRPGDRLACVTGKPYDTLHDVIGNVEDPEPGSLKTLGVSYIETFVDPKDFSDDQIEQALSSFAVPPTRVIHIQKSRGYSSDRRSFSNVDISRLARAARKINPSVIVFVDNCYGEFVEPDEPTAVGADLAAGSLIKNPGGGLAISGGYVVGKKKHIESVLNRITAPGIGGHQGLTFNQNRLVLQGLFLAPTVVSNAVKGALLCSHVFERLGLDVAPKWSEPRFDIIQAIRFGAKERLINFCRAIQMWSPVNAHVRPDPELMPGYQDEVIMAAGTFVEGSTIEFSADGPLRPPFTAFLQGGITYLHVKCVLEEALTLSASGDLRFT